ncbi:hypothetical protein MASR2M8_07770 [Opitutaceae bacterium]
MLVPDRFRVMVVRLVLLVLLVWASSGMELRAADDLAGAPPALAVALTKLLADEDHWASTRTSRYFDKDGKLERTDVERYDPSLPDDQQWRLLLRNGRPPSVAEQKSWLRTRTREMRRRGRPLGAIMDFAAAILAEETRTHWAYSIPIKAGASRRLPAEKFFVLAQVHKERGELDRIAIRTTEAFRVAGVARVENVEADARFNVIDPQYAAQPAQFTAMGSAKVAWLFRVGGRLETEWSQFERVEPYSSRFNVTIGELKALDF